MAIPSTTVYICSGVRLNNAYNHTIYFESSSAQKTFFESKVVKQYNNYVYLRKSWDLRVTATMDEAFNWSYLFFINPGYSDNRRFYYFITDIEYENDNTVILKLELDVMQTYFFDFTTQPCFIEREHTDNDALGANTVDEPLDVGEYIVNSYESSKYTAWCVLILTSVALDRTGFPAMHSSTANGIFSGLAVYACNIKDSTLLGDVLAELMSTEGKSDAIVGMWMYPQDLLTLEDDYSWSDANLFKRLKGCNRHYWTLSMTDTVNGYTPKNKKVLQYPFNFMYLSNNNGGAAVYKYEYFGDPSSIVLATLGTISPEGIAAAYPLNYKGAQHNYDEKLTLTGFPTCAWNSDVYKIWLAQTQNQRETTQLINGLTVAGGVIAAVAGVATGQYGIAAAGAGAAIHSGAAIAQSLAQKEDKSITPPQAQGAQSGSLNMVAGEQQFTIYHKSVDAQHAKIIDDYFSLYGYACKKVKRPNVTSRKTWNYIKTIGSNIVPRRWDRVSGAWVESSICTADVNKINAIYDNGITFWHDPEKVGDYTQDNSIREG